MAKTVFAFGTTVLSPFLNSIFSHTHDDVDDDGHAGKIDLTSHVTGLLPLSSLVTPGTDDIDDDSSFSLADLTAVLEVLYAQYIESLTHIYEYSGSMELKGYASNKTFNFYAQEHVHVGKTPTIQNTLSEILIWVPETYETSTTTYLSIDSTTIPSELRPSTDQCAGIGVIDNSSTGPFNGIIYITASGDWEIRTYDRSAFTASGNKGIGGQLIRYMKSIT
jgi:hypothetical protein